MSEERDRGLVAHRTTNQVLGLVILLAGIAMLILVFLWAYQLYQSIGGETFAARPATAAAQVAGTPSSSAPPAGAVSARPGTGQSPITAALVLFARLLALLVMGWLAGLLASKGVALATGSAAKL